MSQWTFVLAAWGVAAAAIGALALASYIAMRRSEK